MPRTSLVQPRVEWASGGRAARCLKTGKWLMMNYDQRNGELMKVSGEFMVGRLVNQMLS